MIYFGVHFLTANYKIYKKLLYLDLILFKKQ